MAHHRLSNQQVESSQFISLESLASLAAQITLRHANQQPNAVATVRAAKPKALVFADAAQVEIVRTSRDYAAATKVEESALGEPPPLDPPFPHSPLGLLAKVVASPTHSQGQHLAAIALGSNLGDRFANIEAALRLLEHPELISASNETGAAQSLAVVNTSFLYETAPMYVINQPSFLNCACIVRL
jgi:dihydroneopterin aldolase / 2-amino-4-hydroxy-6-hydroxymethyldihydropteridine diphosphokinase / dihydropteroate synthase